MCKEESRSDQNPPCPSPLGVRVLQNTHKINPSPSQQRPHVQRNQTQTQKKKKKKYYTGRSRKRGGKGKNQLSKPRVVPGRRKRKALAEEEEPRPELEHAAQSLAGAESDEHPVLEWLDLPYPKVGLAGHAHGLEVMKALRMLDGQEGCKCIAAISSGAAVGKIVDCNCLGDCGFPSQTRPIRSLFRTLQEHQTSDSRV